MEKTSKNSIVQQQIAHVISEISNPLFVALPTFFDHTCGELLTGVRCHLRPALDHFAAMDAADKLA